MKQRTVLEWIAEKAKVGEGFTAWCKRKKISPRTISMLKHRAVSNLSTVTRLADALDIDASTVWDAIAETRKRG